MGIACPCGDHWMGPEKRKVLMHADKNASSYPSYMQLTFPNGTTIVFETSTAKLNDCITFFNLDNGDHTILLLYDGTNNWVAIYGLLGTQFRTNHQKKNKDLVVKTIHFNIYCIMHNIELSSLLYELAQMIGFMPEKQTLKAAISMTRALNVLQFMLKYPLALQFFNDPEVLTLPTGVRCTQHLLPDITIPGTQLLQFYTQNI
uniref:Uncharacterized protein n=1 Tax=Romanomermis culicivorax TaxID=13658 RepID=A0A915KCD5_ROMCU